MTFSPMLLPAVGLIALVALMLLVRARGRIRAQNLRIRELELVETKAADLERQHHSLGQLMSDYLAFMRDLHDAETSRDVPAMLLEFMAWLFDPEEAIVLMRRRPAVADVDQEHELVVAASIGERVRMGTVLRLGAGELSTVAIAGATLDADRGQGGKGGELAGFVPDLAVPVSIDNENLGVLALMTARKPRMHSRQLLSLFAQSAAFAHKNRALGDAKKAGGKRAPRARRRDGAAVVVEDTDRLEPPPVEADDLERIKGVGPASAAKLRSLGVISYSQIADLDRHGIQDLAQALGTNAERIRREQWLAQARDLIGRPVDSRADS